MLDRYVFKNGKKMRYGYTTGSCAAAASKASTFMALNGQIISKIEIDTPKGWKLNLEIVNPKILDDGSAVCYVKKDGGDDPDITNGILIGAKVKITDNPEIIIKGGKGVGIVTKPGLYLPVGSPAINPVPLKMIKSEIKKILPENKGVQITIIVPEGEKIAKKTFNPKLGILNGISILGTSGIVEPMSDEAFKESLAIEFKMLVQKGIDKVVLVPGNYGEEKAAKYFGIEKRYIIKTSNFIDFMLNKCVELNIKKALLIGHIGKLVKVSAGIFNTHSKIADARREIIGANLALLGASSDVIREIFNCVTTEAAVNVIEKYGYSLVYEVLCKRAEERCMDYSYGELEVGVIMFSMEKGILHIGDNAKKILEEFK
ncbi:cobalt-precorrin-5B (C(1))-methyltransferase CbiD [Caminicella sporogenes]|uniref:cobalt-precorrin-5B (C(1))-methyltransferase CbiD n=1 Tax=Caminicella sporogenes TaxID=166485 RepID=UPI002541342C|nr:cobalt-precorrin-5B (C(1))-methyltransferase CbiD [Caminicella sporogenes]WIF94960.1 cobalt-precorrin-5B (C(1))-methyltransferase CbiD [Caminicella sporogenes]